MSREASVIQEARVERTCIFPAQIYCAKQIVKRIRFILHHYHSYKYGRELESFGAFDFRIYTANSNMIWAQTVNRLCDPRAECFNADMYADEKKLRENAEKRVHKYRMSKTTAGDLRSLENEVARNPTKLFLIVADESHRGTTPGGNNDQLINGWNHEKHMNVIVLLVTATPFSLLNSNSRIPLDVRVAEDMETDGRLMGVISEGRRMKTFDGTDVTGRVNALKSLHVVRWSESFQQTLQDGQLVTFRIVSKCRKEPVWLCIEEKEQPVLYNVRRWIGTVKREDAREVLVKKVGDFVEISTPDEQYVLVALAFNGVVGFIKRQSLTLLRKKDAVRSITFNVQTKFCESLLEFRLTTGTSRVQSQLCFNNDHFAVLRDGACGYIGTVGRRGVDADDETTYCAPRSGIFLVEKIRHMQTKTSHSTSKQYLSLNFYFNSMRNEDPQRQLIRGDDTFNAMIRSDALKEFQPDEILAADYAYCIIIVDQLRRHFSETIEWGDAFFTKDGLMHKYIESKRDQIQRMKSELRSLDCGNEMKVKPVKPEVFIAVVNHYSQRAQEKMQQLLLKSKRTDDTIEAFLRCVSYATSLDDFHEIFSDQSLSQKLKSALNKQSIESRCINVTRSTHETLGIINNLIVRTEHLAKDAQGHMKIVRLNSKMYGNMFYETICLSRTLCSCGSGCFFEVIKYFDTHNVPVSIDTSSPGHRIRPAMQQGRACIHEQCPCKHRSEDTLECQNCHHVHKKIEQLADIDGLPCIVIVVEKARMGDTFPPSLNVMDLRVLNAQPTHASLHEEWVRLCRYQERSADDSDQLPCVLLPATVLGYLREALNENICFFVAVFGLDNRICRNHKAQKQRFEHDDNDSDYDKHRAEIKPVAHSDCGNSETHNNRIILLAEPHIGTTGTCLKTIGLIRHAIQCCNDEEYIACDEIFEEEEHETSQPPEDGSSAKAVLRGTDTEEESEDCRSSEESNHDDNRVQVDEPTEEHADQEVEADTIERDTDSDSSDDYIDNATAPEKFPFWKNMKPGNLKEKITGTKYWPCFGDYVYGERPDFFTPSAAPRIRPERNRSITRVAENDRSHCTYSKSDKVANCDQCDAEGNSEDEQSRESKMRYGESLEARVIVPSLERFEPLRTLLRLPSCASSGHRGPERDGGSVPLLTWIFNPSYGRPADASVNYCQAMACSGRGRHCDYVQILVVRREEFSEYAKNWQTTHAILELPVSLPGCDVDVNAGGIGFSRRFIQMVAESNGLSRIFMIDDSASKVYEVQAENNEIQNVPLCKVLRALEAQFDCSSKVDVPNFEPYEGLENIDDVCGGNGSNGRVHRYTGPNSMYGVLGIRKFRKIGRFSTGFKRTHVHSLILLNVEALRNNGINYQPWPVREDLNLNNDCDSRGLIVCKYNRFVLSRRQLTPWLPSVYLWNNDSELTNADRLPQADENANTVRRWIALVAAPKRIEVRKIAIDSLPIKVDLSVMYETSMRHTMEALFKVQGGHSHLVTFFGDADIGVRTDSQDDDRRSLLLVMKEYFQTTKGIGGFSKHIILLAASLCLQCGLRKVDDFRRNIVDEVLQTDSELCVVSSHNVKFFRVPFVVLYVKGKLSHPVDQDADGNISGCHEQQVDFSDPSVSSTVASVASTPTEPIAVELSNAPITTAPSGVDLPSTSSSVSLDDVPCASRKRGHEDETETSAVDPKKPKQALDEYEQFMLDFVPELRQLSRREWQRAKAKIATLINEILPDDKTSA